MTAPVPLPEAVPPAPPARATLTGAIVVGAVLLVSLLALWPRYTPSARDPRLVAVLPFQFQTADSGLAVLSEGMVDLFDARLTGEQGFRTLAPVVAIRAWREVSGGRVEARVPEPEALAIAERLDAAFLLMGTIEHRDRRLEVEAALLAVPDGRVLGQFRTAAPVDSIARIVNELVTRFVASRRAAGLEPGTPLPHTVPAAMLAWLEGRASYREGQYAQAATEFQRALAADSAFPHAALWAAMAARRLDRPVPPLAVDTTRLAPRDRALYRAILPAPDVRAEYRNWSAADSLAARRPEPAVALAELLLDFGGFLEQDSAAGRAMGLAERALAVEPGTPPALEALVRAAAAAGDTARLRRAMDAVALADSVGAWSGFAEWRAALLLGTPAELTALSRRLPDLPDATLLRILGAAQVEGQGLEQAEAAAAILWRRHGEAAPGFGARLYHLHRNLGRPAEAQPFRAAVPTGLILEAALFGGDLTEAAARAQQVRTALPAPDSLGDRAGLDALCELATWESAHGEADSARALLARLALLVQSRGSGVPPCEAIAEGLLAVREGRPLPAAVRAALEELHQRVLRAGELRVPAQLLLAWDRELAGDPAAGLAYLALPAGVDAGPAWLADLLRERGRLAQRAGLRDLALRAYEHYLALRSAPAPAYAEEVAAVRRAHADLLAAG